MNEDGSLKEVQIYEKSYRGKALYDVLECYVRKAFKSDTTINTPIAEPTGGRPSKSCDNPLIIGLSLIHI